MDIAHVRVDPCVKEIHATVGHLRAAICQSMK
jgi:hypothetical protein